MNNNDDIILYDTRDSLKQEPQQELDTFDLIPPDWPSLHKVMPEFDFENPRTDPNTLASTLVETCKKHNGLGLSANQCGEEHRVFVMGSGNDYIACFNPKILSSKDEAHMPEGCLSFPLLQLRITRPKRIEVEYQDWTGEKHTATFDGMTARIFQHELDHLNGIVYTDKVKPLALQSGLKKIEKFKRKYLNPKMMKQLKNNGNQKNNP